MEHLHHFNLNQDPFQNEPDLRFYYASAYHRDAQLRLDRGLRQRKGLCVLTGEGGTGKTLLARRILETLEEEVFDANLMVMLAGAADAESVLTRFARQVGVEAPSEDRSTLLADIYEQLAIVREDGRHCVLILDDAQILKRDAMAEVSGLLNLEYEDRRLLSLLLVGLPELDVTISHEPSLAQRVDVRVHLQPLDLESSAAYLMHRLGVVGGSAEIFPEEAVTALHKFGRGRPRLLNTLADNALFEAYLAGSHVVDASNVEHAAGDLGIGLDPGSTYESVPVQRAPAAPVPLPQPAANLEDPVLGTSAGQEPFTSTIDSTGDGELDLASLLDDDSGPDGDLTVLSLDAPAEDGGGGMRDLDAELLLGESSAELPTFTAQDGPAPMAPDATRVALGDELMMDELPTAEEEPPDGPDEIDDLFVELIEE